MLVVDDEEVVRIAAQRILMQLGFEVVLAADGQAALDACAADSPGFSLVLLDVLMPGLGGFAVLERLRREHPALPVLLVSGHVGEASRDRVLCSGAAGYLGKPFDVRELCQALDSALASTRVEVESSSRVPAKAH